MKKIFFLLSFVTAVCVAQTKTDWERIAHISDSLTIVSLQKDINKLQIEIKRLEADMQLLSCKYDGDRTIDLVSLYVGRNFRQWRKYRIHVLETK